MGGTVSREHARLPFGYTHARKEDHSCSASASSLASRRQRIANRLLLLKNQDSTTSVTPLQSPHRLPLAEDGSHLVAGGAATGATGVTGNGEGGPVGPAGSMAAHLSLPSLSSQDDDDDDDEDNAEIVSLSSILNQGPEFKLQWHAVSQDLDQDPNVHTYPYPYTYPVLYPGVSSVAVATGPEAAKASTPMVEAQVQVQVAEDNNNHHHMLESSPSSPSLYIRSPAFVCAATAAVCAHGDYETAAGGASSNPGLGSPASLVLTSGESAANHRKDSKDAHMTDPSVIPLVLTSQPHASFLSQSRTTVSVSTAAATATATNTLHNNHNHNHNHNHNPHALSLSALPSSDNTLNDKINSDNDNDDGLNTVYDKNSNYDTTSLHHQQEENNTEPAHSSPQWTTQNLDPFRQSSSQQDLIGSASTVFEDDFDDSDDELKGPSDRKMDLIAALGITDMPDRAPSPGPQDIPFSFFTEEPTFHALQDPTSCQLFNTRRYTADGGGYSKGKEVRRPWMDQTDETVVHLPQDFFDRYGPSQQDLDGDGLGYDFDGDFEQEEQLPRPRRLGKRLSLGNTGYSTSGANFGGHNVSANSAMMMNMMMLSAPDEDVTHLSPIPFSELPSLTNIGLCSHGIVKLSSNIRLLSSTTCLQVCCNDLCVIPPEIGFLRNLTLLDLSKNSLMTIPDSIRFLTKLIDLRLSGNFIDTLPPSIGELTKLTHLSLENNQLKRVPRQLGQLKALTHLVLDDNPITVLPAEVGQLQYLRRLKLERCPLVREFVHSPVHSPPTLMELAARVILRQGMMVPPLMPSHLKAYLRSSQRCSFCDGPYFESSVKRGKMIEKNELLVPLEYTLCMPHWNTEMERVKLLFGPRPMTSPKPCTPRQTVAATGLLTTTPEAGAATSAESATTTPSTIRRHTKSESAGPVLASTAAGILGGSSSSPVSASPVGQAPLTFSLTHLSSIGSTIPPMTDMTSPNSSSSYGRGNGSSGRKTRGLRSKLGSSGSNSGWFSSSNNNSETNLTAASALPPLRTSSSVSTMASIATAAGVSGITTTTYPELSSMSMGMSVTPPPLNSRSSFSSRTKKSRFPNPFASSRASSSGSIAGGGGGGRRSPSSP
ncbi:hypothetical protein BGZ96_009099 [Linnemannia gamsii]|uniref:L domain-like protein n=1 Tax=Linnemannia gamsii TaxID=64522 RepID=A0ABQ7JXG3_9FUNG|nr:hypothetical protein BGZ96_009099 [Linnemannia gamsii]